MKIKMTKGAAKPKPNDFMILTIAEISNIKSENAKLIDIAERLYKLAMKNDVRWSFEEDGDSLAKIRAELDQIKEDGK